MPQDAAWISSATKDAPKESTVGHHATSSDGNPGVFKAEQNSYEANEVTV